MCALKLIIFSNLHTQDCLDLWHLIVIGKFCLMGFFKFITVISIMEHLGL